MGNNVEDFENLEQREIMTSAPTSATSKFGPFAQTNLKALIVIVIYINSSWKIPNWSMKQQTAETNLGRHNFLWKTNFGETTFCEKSM